VFTTNKTDSYDEKENWNIVESGVKLKFCIIVQA
jgi:hypothetical protein